jgi:hypothetical protein
LRLTSDRRPLRCCADQLQRDRRSWYHLSADIQDAVHARNATFKVSTLLVDGGGEQKVADGVSTWCAGFSGEAKAQKIGGGGLRIREGHQTVPQVTHRRDPELLAQHS